MSHLESFGGTDQSYPASCRVDVDMDICLPEPVVEYICSGPTANNVLDKRVDNTSEWLIAP